VAKIARKAATQIMVRDEQAVRDAKLLHGLVFPEKHLQERLYSIIPFLAKFGPGLMDEIYSAVRIECPITSSWWFDKTPYSPSGFSSKLFGKEYGSSI